MTKLGVGSVVLLDMYPGSDDTKRRRYTVTVTLSSFERVGDNISVPVNSPLGSKLADGSDYHEGSIIDYVAPNKNRWKAKIIQIE